MQIYTSYSRSTPVHQIGTTLRASLYTSHGQCTSQSFAPTQEPLLQLPYDHIANMFSCECSSSSRKDVLPVYLHKTSTKKIKSTVSIAHMKGHDHTLVPSICTTNQNATRHIQPMRSALGMLPRNLYSDSTPDIDKENHLGCHWMGSSLFLLI